MNFWKQLIALLLQLCLLRVLKTVALVVWSFGKRKFYLIKTNPLYWSSQYAIKQKRTSTLSYRVSTNHGLQKVCVRVGHLFFCGFYECHCPDHLR